MSSTNDSSKHRPPEESTNGLDWALYYAAIGWHVVPVHTPTSDPDSPCSCGAAGCSGAGKHPRISDWTNQASTDAAVLRGWWRRWPDANVGVLTGTPSGFFVLDIDPRNGGDASLDDLEDQHGELPETVEAHTGGGGRHLLFRLPQEESVGCENGVLPGLDIKGDGGLIVVAPSLHKSGKRYVWESSCLPEAER